MRPVLAALVLLCSVMPALAQVQKLVPPEVLLLEVWLDGASDHTVVPVTVEDGKIFMRAEDLRKQKVQFTASGDKIDLGQVDGLVAKVDQENQRLVLTVEAAKLPTQHFDLRPSEAGPSDTPGTGAILHYDLTGTVDNAARWGRGQSAGGDASLDIFTPAGLFSTSGFGNLGQGAGFKGARLDSSVEFDREDTLTHLLVGDTISGGPNWARGVRYGGVQYASDFSIRPDLVTTPLPDFFGQSQVPATVDVFSGAAKVFEQDIQAGPFDIRNLPIVTGGGDVTIVTHDVLGRQTSQNLALYTDPSLLEAGLSSYSVDAGFLRTGYGLNSFGYDTPVASGTYRHGLSKFLTMEAHVEGAPGFGQASVGAAGSIANFATVSADIASSRGLGGSGTMESVTASTNKGAFSFNVSAMLDSPGFRDLASIGGAPPPRLRYQVGASANAGSWGNLGLGWLGSKPQTGPASEYLTASYSVPLPGGSYLSATALRDIIGRDTNVQISLIIPLGGRDVLSVSGQSDKGYTGTAMWDHPVNPDGGLGYRILGQSDRGDRLEGDVNWIGHSLGADGDVAVQHGDAALRADLQGALVMMRGSIFAVHDAGGAVALVETGVPDIHVYRENRDLGKSDANGELLLTGLDAYAANHIAIEPRDYAFDVVVDKTETIVRPRRRSGVVVNMAPAVRHPIVAVITRGVSMPVPLGARVRFEGEAEPLVVGHDGLVFIPDLPHAVDASVELGGLHCRVHIEPVSTPGALMPRTPPLLCLREANGAY